MKRDSKLRLLQNYAQFNIKIKIAMYNFIYRISSPEANYRVMYSKFDVNKNLTLTINRYFSYSPAINYRIKLLLLLIIACMYQTETHSRIEFPMNF